MVGNTLKYPQINLKSILQSVVGNKLVSISLPINRVPSTVLLAIGSSTGSFLVLLKNSMKTGRSGCEHQ